jgi:predicted ATPase
MKISIYNFKSIGSVVNYELKPLTILSGVNSSGKSSFIQLLLLLKQTIELESPKHPLYLNGDYYKVQAFRDIVRGKDLTQIVRVVFDIEKSEFEAFSKHVTSSIYDSYPGYRCTCDIGFAADNGDVNIKEFSLKYALLDGSDKTNEQYIRFWHRPTGLQPFEIETTNDYFGKGIWEKANAVVTSISYAGIFPNGYEVKEVSQTEGIREGEPIIESILFRETPNIDSIKEYLTYYFGQLHYVGPLRLEPQDQYSYKNDHATVGKAGENVAQVLGNFANSEVKVFIPQATEDNMLAFEEQTMTLIDATTFWVCTVFKFGKKISVKRTNEDYSIRLVTHDNIETTIKHVGFGISQVLPIIVEGLLMSSDGTLVLEQPEIHLHPKIQSSLFDFAHSLALAGKKIIIETHSDHFITRMRRRVAEDDTNEILPKIHLTFVETSNGNLTFRTLDLDDYGTVDFFPDDFIEKTDAELKAIVNAQMKKRLSKHKE